MDSKELKNNLKQAGEAIRANDNKKAYEHCMAILKVDSKNYNALVYLGVSAQRLGETDKAAEAFKKAVQIEPDQILAWKGLGSFYEKNSSYSHSQELVETYEKMNKLLENERSQQLEVVIKLAALYKTRGDIWKCAETLQLQAELQEDQQSKYKTWFSVIDLYSNLEAAPSELLHQAYTEVMNSELLQNDERRFDFYKNYLLYFKNVQKRSLTDCVSEARRLFALLPQFSFALEFLCQLLVQAAIDDEELLVIGEIEELVQNLQKHGCRLWLASICNGVKQYFSRNYIEALKLLRIETSHGDAEIDLLVTKVQLAVHDYTGAQRSAQLGLQKLKNYNQEQLRHLKSKFHVALGRALLGQKLLDSALKALNKSDEFVVKNPEVLENQIKVYIALNAIEDAEVLFKENRVILGEKSACHLEGELLFSRKEYEKAEEKFLKCLDHGESCLVYHKLGIIKWERKEHNEAVSYFLKAARLDAFFGRNFLYLGHFYMLRNDVRKAQQCYKKAYELNVADEEAAKALSDSHSDTEDKEFHLQLLKSMIEKNGMKSPRWVWLRLGVMQLQKMDFVSAITSLQNALKIDYSDSHCWECLGDAYLQQGSYNAAFKAFNKVAELRPDDIYPLFRMASIKQDLGCYGDAIGEYKKILSIKDGYVPALKGLGETLLLEAKKYLEQFLFDLSKDYSLEAVQAICKGLITHPELSCMWKLIGDACQMISELGNHHFPIAFPLELIQLSQSTSSVTLDKNELLSFGSRAYQKAICLNRGIAGLWHDLGVSYLRQSQSATDDGDRKTFGQKSLLCLQHAVTLEPNNREHWTALGVVAAVTVRNYGLAQHAFIKSITVETNNPKAWSNLGILYLLNKNMKLTHEALNTAQSLEPANPLPWIGQALIAEQVQHAEALDLFRHATNLGNHREAFLGYAHWICRVLQDKELEKTTIYNYRIYKTFALPAAADGLIKYTANSRFCAISYYLLAELLERMNQNSLTAAHNAAILGKSNLKDLAFRRFARSLRLQGRKKEALHELKAIASPDVGVFCELALAQLGSDDLDSAYKAYEEVLKLAPNEEVASHVLVAMAIIARKLGHAQDAKTLLFQSFQKKPASVFGFMALCALGLLENDPPLVVAAIAEIQPFKHHPEFCIDIAHLLACQYAQQGDAIGNLKQYSKAVHDQPNVAELWAHMARSIIMWQPWKTKLAVRCSTVATCHSCKSVSHLNLLVTLCHLLAGNVKSSLKAAQKSVHMQPDNVSCWSTLLSVMSTSNPNNDALPKLFTFVKELDKTNGGGQQTLQSWIHILEVYMYLSRRDYALAAELLKSILQEPVRHENILPAAHILAIIMESAVPQLSTVVQQHPDLTFGWLALLRLQMAQGQFNEAEICIRHWLQFMATLQLPDYQKVTPLLGLALLALEAHKKSDKKEKWLTLCQEAVTEVLKLNSTCQAALFIRALIGTLMENKGSVTSSLKRVVVHSSKGEVKWIEKIACNQLFKIYASKQDVKGLQMVLQYAEMANDKELVEKLLHVPLCLSTSQTDGP